MPITIIAMKLIFSILAFSLFAAPAVAEPKKPTKAASAVQQFDPVQAFQALVGVASQKKTWSRTHQNSQSQKWIRHDVARGDIRYDVKKTDSLINPMVGIVSFPVLITYSPFYESQQEALDSTAPPKGTMSYAVDVTYRIDGSKWVMQEIKYVGTDRDNPLRGSEFKMDKEKLERERNSTLVMALAPWADQE